MTKMDKEYIEKEYEQAIKEFQRAALQYMYRQAALQKR